MTHMEGRPGELVSLWETRIIRKNSIDVPLPIKGVLLYLKSCSDDFEVGTNQHLLELFFFLGPVDESLSQVLAVYLLELRDSTIK